MRLRDNPSACVEPEYRRERTCRECYFSQVNEKNQWTGTQRCWNAGCIEADTGDTPNDKLRAMLDERGIEWKSETNCDTYWRGRDRTFYQFTEYSDGSTTFSTCQLNLTPKQALTTPIAATVDEEPEMHICKRCGVAYELNIIDKGYGKPRFCPNCGFRKDAQ